MVYFYKGKYQLLTDEDEQRDYTWSWPFLPLIVLLLLADDDEMMMMEMMMTVPHLTKCDICCVSQE